MRRGPRPGHGLGRRALYVRPEDAGHGIGGDLLAVAKSLRPGGFDLWCFQRNLPAQRFYLRHGLLEVERTDGANNEEHAPDIRYRWRGSGAG